MKNKRIERMRRTMRQYHQHNPWRLEGGLFIPHSYPTLGALSWWDDVGFIQGGRRVMVWWVHPRMSYADAIEHRALEIAGPFPPDAFEAQKTRGRLLPPKRQLNRTTHRAPWYPDQMAEHAKKVMAIEDRLIKEGIDLVVFPSLKIQHYRWGMGMSLCASTELRELADIRNLAAIARQLIKREIRLDEAFPSDGYTKEDWMREAELRNARTSISVDHASARVEPHQGKAP